MPDFSTRAVYFYGYSVLHIVHDFLLRSAPIYYNNLCLKNFINDFFWEIVNDLLLVWHMCLLEYVNQFTTKNLPQWRNWVTTKDAQFTII
jgi:hypothetical protein